MLSLSIRKLCTHSQSSYGVYTLQAHVWFKIVKFSREIILFILTLSTHVSGFTLHTVTWFTLSKHMLGSKFSNFHTSFFFSYLHSPHMFQDSLCIVTLQAHVRFKIYKFSREFFFFILTLSTRLRIHSPYSYLVYTLQAHVRFKIFKFSREIIFSLLHSPHMFQGSLSIQLFGLHSPSTC